MHLFTGFMALCASSAFAAIGWAQAGSAGGALNGPIVMTEPAGTPSPPALMITREGSGSPGDGPLLDTQLHIDLSGNQVWNWVPLQSTLRITGAPNGVGNGVLSRLILSSSRGSRGAGPKGANSEYSALAALVTKSTPAEGFKPVGPQGWNLWLPFADETNLPSSVANADVGVEQDLNVNNLDDASDRFGYQMGVGVSKRAGWHGDVGYDLYANCFKPIWCREIAHLGGGFENAALDLRYAATEEPRITSPTPTAETIAITVDDVLPLAGGGVFAGGWGHMGGSSLAAVTGHKVAGRPAPAVIVVDSAAGLGFGMYIYDLTRPRDVPANTRIERIEEQGLLLSNDVDAEPGDDLLFARAQKDVTIAGRHFVVAAVALAKQGSPAGTVWFTAPVPPWAAATGRVILPGAHTIWMQEGQTNPLPAPPGDIAFNRAGTVTLACNSAAPCTGVAVGGHLGFTGGAPSLSACGQTPALDAGATDSDGTITLGEGGVASCTLSFATTFPRPPRCTLTTDTGAAFAYVASRSPDAVRIGLSAPLARGAVTYHCVE